MFRGPHIFELSVSVTEKFLPKPLQTTIAEGTKYHMDLEKPLEEERLRNILVLQRQVVALGCLQALVFYLCPVQGDSHPLRIASPLLLFCVLASEHPRNLEPRTLR